MHKTFFRDTYFDRRGHKRFKVPNDAFALINHRDTVLVGQILDMSADGFSVHCDDHLLQMDDIFTIDIILDDAGLYTKKIPIIIIYAHTVNYKPEDSTNYLSMCRYGIQFRTLKYDHSILMENLTPNHPNGFIHDRRHYKDDFLTGKRRKNEL